MFVNQHHLQYLLSPEHYFSQEHYDREIQSLFLPAWQFVTTKSELPKPGDFITLELFGHLLMIRNCDGEYRAFQNVCSHRHAMLTSLSKGCSPVIRCQYHGWEYDKNGKTRKIPDARCFRPWDRDNSHLVTYRLEACGDALFVALTDELPSLKEWLSPYFEDLERHFSAPEWSMNWAWEYDCDCNWKVPVENTLESYHIQTMHKKTFGSFYPLEDKSIHTLEHNYTVLEYLAHQTIQMLQARMRKNLGGTPQYKYNHFHFHPNTVFVTTDTFTYLTSAVPLSPTKVRMRLRAWGLGHSTWNPLYMLTKWYSWLSSKSMIYRVMMEDLAVYAAQQRGVEVSRQKGVIGTREERIFAFQEYLLKSLDIPLPPPSAEPVKNRAKQDVHV